MEIPHDEQQAGTLEPAGSQAASPPPHLAEPPINLPPPPRGHLLNQIFMGPQGLRAGWSVLIFLLLAGLFSFLLLSTMGHAHLIARKPSFTPRFMFFSELAQLVSLLAAAAVMARIERRRLADYNLTGPRRTAHFFSGLAVGFAALSALVGGLTAGHWLRFNGLALNGIDILRWGAFWGLLFLMVGCFEEGSFRCYLQWTLTRGLNFWWALGILAAACAVTAARARGNGVWGAYAIVLIGLIPCYLLHRKAAPRSGFWQAAWVTSALFALAHTSNGGENWIGIFAAGAIGFVFCVSIYMTGSAWWAIGTHAGWDWAETYFYGTPDSGLVAKGHLLNTSPVGNVFWSGGSDGPEGSALILGILVLLFIWLMVVYGRNRGEAALTQERSGSM